MTPARDTLLQVAHAGKTFDVSPPWLTRVLGRQHRLLLHAVDDVSFDIRRGETLGLVGESGCGKSTVARLIVGLYRLSSGAITYAGMDVGTLAYGRRQSHAAPQAADDFPGSVCEPESALARRRYRCRADPRAAPAARSPRDRGARRRAADAGRASPRRTATSIRISFPAGSASGFRSRARSRAKRSSWSATSRRPRSTSPCRRRC